MIKPFVKTLKPVTRLRQIARPNEKRSWLAAIGVSALIVVGPLLAFSETTLRALVDRWLRQCIVVIDVDLRHNEAPIARVYLFGDMPASLPLTFAAGRGVIERISLINQVEQTYSDDEINLLVHPLANQRCPGDLCPDQTGAAEKLTVRIKPVSSNYAYQFRILTSTILAEDQIRVYSKPLKEESISCRIERSSITNYLARQSPLAQAFLLFAAVACLTLVAGFVKRLAGEDK